MFDFILFSHVFYHIPKKGWDEIIADSLRLLKPNGFIAVVLDSFEGQAYELLDLITENKTRVDTLEFGDLYFAEDMEGFLAKNRIEYSVNAFTTNIFIQEDGDELYNFARILAFSYRTFPDKILANYKDDIEKFMMRTKQDNRYVLEDRAKIIIVYKK